MVYEHCAAIAPITFSASCADYLAVCARKHIFALLRFYIQTGMKNPSTVPER